MNMFIYQVLNIKLWTDNWIPNLDNTPAHYASGVCNLPDEKSITKMAYRFYSNLTPPCDFQQIPTLKNNPESTMFDCFYGS